jgi:hypothetical protein
MIINKITNGFVIQEFDTETNKFIHLEFCASDECAIENKHGEAVDIAIDEYLSFDMVQPSI